MKKLLVFMLAALFAAGCSNGSSKSPVIAKVDGTAITKEDFIEEINRVPEWARARFLTEEGKKQFLDELIKKELIYEAARKNGLHRDEDYKDRVKEFKKMTLVKMALDKEVEEKAKLDLKEVRDYYDSHSDEFMVGLEVRASHILVNTEAEADDIVKNIKQGKKFSGLAKKLSKDKGSADKGGDLGFFRRGRMVPEFETVAFSLKLGQVSDPVKTRFGYHIIKVTDRKEGRQGNFEEVKDTIARQLKMEKQKNLFESYIASLKEGADIKTQPYEAELLGIKIGEEQAAPETGQ